jgi:hypothetical protein
MTDFLTPICTGPFRSMQGQTLELILFCKAHTIPPAFPLFPWTTSYHFFAAFDSQSPFVSVHFSIAAHVWLGNI